MVRGLFLTLMLFFLTPGTVLQAADTEGSAEQKSAIRGVIEAQLEAFGRDDGVTAFSYASPTIKRLFGSPERFMAMVRSGYPEVYRPHGVAFGELHRANGILVQEIRLTGPDGRSIIALYSLIHMPDGRWLIDGVVTRPLPERAI